MTQHRPYNDLDPRLKLNAVRISAIIKAIRVGAPFGEAFAFARVGRATAYRWWEEGKKRRDDGSEGEFVLAENGTIPNPPLVRGDLFVAFANALDEAEAFFVVANLNHIEKAAARDWKAAAWRLERRKPDDFGRRERIDADLRHVGADPVGDEVAAHLRGLRERGDTDAIGKLVSSLLDGADDEDV